MANYKAGDEAVIELGGLKFVIMHRAIGDDGGASIEVFGDVDGKDLQVLRFDCFRKAPHYHHAPMGKNINTARDTAAVGDGVDWAMAQVRDNIPEMLKAAGYDELADRVDGGAFKTGWKKVKEAVVATAPAA